MGTNFRSHFLRSWRMAIAASLLLHAGVLLSFAMHADSHSGAANARSKFVILSPQSIDDEEPRNSQPSSDDPVANALNVSEVQKEIDEFEIRKDASPDGSNEPSSYVASQIKRSVRIGQKHSPERNEKDLSILSERLSRESSEKSVDEMAKFLQGVAGAPRASSKVPSRPDKPIDPKTAQVEDVTLVVDEQGTSHYIATMVDATGVTIDVELEPEIGEQLHRTMKLIKSNPLLERVYRQMVMGLLDQMLKPQTEKVPE